MSTQSAVSGKRQHIAQRKQSTSLYIHWPFCKAKCPYCDFNSHVRDSVNQDAWRDAMITELRWYAERYNNGMRPVGRIGPSAQLPKLFGEREQSEQSLRETECFVAGQKNNTLKSIFFGGGTPSLMPPSTVEALLNEAEKLFGFDDDIEITLEANPTSVEAANFKDIRRAGVNRASLGVQSFQPEALTFLGREHSVNEAKHAIALAAETFSRYSFDLIYALPDQTLAQWEAELTDALQLADKHLSLYQLTIEPGTQFFHHHASGKLKVPGESLAADFYQLTQRIMEAASMPAYEISNHARTGEASRHNLAYWQGGDYLGIGPGAHGRMTILNQRHATLNLRSPEKWLTQTHAEKHGQEEDTPLTPQHQWEEAILMGLRLTDGLEASNLPLNGKNLHDMWPPTLLKALEEEDLITTTPTNLRPTLKGRLLLTSLTTALADGLLLQ